MATDLEKLDRLAKWTAAERQALTEDIKWLKAGAKLTSPSGDDISATKLATLEARLEHANLMMALFDA